jgi:hypothetical protein
MTDNKNPYYSSNKLHKPQKKTNKIQNKQTSKANTPKSETQQWRLQTSPNLSTQVNKKNQPKTEANRYHTNSAPHISRTGLNNANFTGLPTGFGGGANNRLQSVRSVMIKSQTKPDFDTVNFCLMFFDFG